MHISRKGAAATLTAAAMLVVGVDYATFAANGDSLILGHLNHAHNTTMLVKNQPGPVLRLTSNGNLKPSLAVSSNARVPHLNADLLDGQTATTLASNAVTFQAGSRRDVYPGSAFWELPLQPGLYQASFEAFVLPQGLTEGMPVGVICGVADLNTLDGRAHVYVAGSSTTDGSDGIPPIMSGAETVRITAAANPGLLCVVTNGNDFRLFQPLRTSWTPINARQIQVLPQFMPPTPVRNGLVQQLTR